MTDTPRRTKIVATLGPTSWEEPTLSKLVAAGVDVFRINCSHADHASIRRQVARARRAAAQAGKPVGILLDLQGPKIRTGPVPTPIALAPGDLLTVVMDDTLVGSGQTVGTTYPEMARDVSVGAEVLFDDGALMGVVHGIDLEKVPAEVVIRMTVGGDLKSHKGLNFPDVVMSVPSLTEKDVADLAVGVEVGVDFVALSFVRRAADVLALRREMRALGVNLPIVAKIEKPEAVRYFDEILEVTEGIMVARGDLGVEMKLERVPVVQKEIIEKAFQKGAMVITATQMLDSMIRNPRPTRAETTDVANAILDGTDAIMLSGETASGAWPVEAVETMDRIAREVEQSRFFRPTPVDEIPAPKGPAGTILRSACWAITEERRPLVVFTWSGYSAVIASKARPKGPIFAFAPTTSVMDRLSLAWGVTPFHLPEVRSVDDLIAAGERVLQQKGLVKPGEELVIVAGSSPMRGATNLLKIDRVGG
jgi:pyruvate kinase